jgi:hypothetical protein
MPIVVNTELGSGLPDARGFKPVQPEDVADAIVEALELGRVDVYVPKRVGPVVRAQHVLPRRVVDLVTHFFRGDQVLAQPDHAARAAYEARMAALIGDSAPVGAASPSLAEPEKVAVD